ncbi:acetyl-CoA carboxylase biotin carboxyl carrier protein subunit [Nocardioides sp.]|uniref:acetyl-CoA carboxylase biotin carboxyl carrier protein subunit n=1 Tax=Nocardioides sp. TaxID=35761 RepID=UPI00261B87D0|nr:acetyl-CoA carboxylase biotin carboxyl carrier protein subunit [Nocardioides sp.]MDI6912310.1 acetyl-CoA carboxylase biotin carboxyl carrier protein subunit [Nocardioides sp.]
MPTIAAHVTGVVTKIEVGRGSHVTEGDTVAVLESMKMEMFVEAECAGTVTEVLCEVGQSVKEGELLVELA